MFCIIVNNGKNDIFKQWFLYFEKERDYNE